MSSTSTAAANIIFQEDCPMPPRRKCLSANLSMDSTATESTTLTEASYHEREDTAFGALHFAANRFVGHHKGKADRFQKHYTLGPMLGKGGFGTCFQCTHKATGQLRACKLLPKSSNRKDNRAVFHEFKTLASLDHPNLLKVYELFEDKKYFFIITELYEGGDLFDLIEKEGPLKEQDAAVVIQRLLCCLNYLHENDLVHRDLKPENVLLTGNDFANFKLIDFGLARKEKPDEAFSSIVGSPFYISPQVVDGNYRRGCDIWALGVIAYVMLSGKPPFEAASDMEVLEKIQVGWVHFDHAAFDTVSAECTAFIRYLMTYEEDERPTAAQALQHPWLQQQTQVVKAVASVQDIMLGKDVENALRALQRYQSRDCKLKQAVGALVASQFVTQRERLDAVFRVLDRSQTGTLTLHDLQLAFADRLNVYFAQDELVEQLWPHIHTSGSGTAIAYSEFLAVVTLEGPNSASKVQQVYQYLDTDGKGYLNTRDLQVGLKLDQETADFVCQKMIAEVTKSNDDDDEVITRPAFEAVVSKRVAKRQSTTAIHPRAPTTARRKPLRRSRSMVAGAA